MKGDSIILVMFSALLGVLMAFGILDAREYRVLPIGDEGTPEA